MTMNRNAFYAIIGLLAIAAAIFAYQPYQERKTTGLEINVNKSVISIEKK
jgi:hypothetical protein